MRGGVPHLGGLPGQPCRVTRLGGVSFLHVNAEGGVGWCLAGHLSIIKPIERLSGRLKMLNLMPNISVRQDKPSSGATLNGKDFKQDVSAMHTKISRYLV